MIRFGLIGLGRWGRRLAEVLDREAELAWCCSTPGGGGREWALGHLPGVRWTADADELITSDAVDAIAIATPVSTHVTLAERALSAGKHVFVEKPLATDVVRAERVRRLADRSAGVLMVDHTFLFDTNLSRLVDMARDDPPQRISMRWGKWGTFDDPMLWSLFPHDVALSLSLLDETPRGSTADGDPADPECHRSAVTLSYRSGRTVDMEVDRMATSRVKEVHVVAESGRELLWRNGELLSLHRGPVPLHAAEASALPNAVRHFVDVVEGRSAARSDARFAVEVTRTLCGISGRTSGSS